VPDAATRDGDFDRWLPPNSRHPDAAGPFLSVPERTQPQRTDLGVWNVYANPEIPAPQLILERLLNPAGTLSRDEVLARALARFKTSTVRNLGHSAPYLHTGQLASVEDVIVFYQHMSDLARAGRMRNPPPEYYAMRIGAEDVAPLAAFMRALNEDLKGSDSPTPATTTTSSAARGGHAGNLVRRQQ
jgi:cytochrome c peroxidase